MEDKKEEVDTEEGLLLFKIIGLLIADDEYVQDFRFIDPDCDDGQIPEQGL
jgi:hypothetical protein